MSAPATDVAARRETRHPQSGRQRPRLIPSAVPVQELVSADAGGPAERVPPMVLDVRDSPMTAGTGRTLAVLESLELGRRVLHVTSFVPWPLLAMLETRGIRYEIQDRKDDEVRILMWRHSERKRSWPYEPRVEVVRAP